MLNIFTTSLFVLGGIGVLLGVIASKWFRILWNVCRIYYAIYTVLAVAALGVGILNDHSLASLMNLTQLFGPAILASGGWTIYAHLALTTPKSKK